MIEIRKKKCQTVLSEVLKFLCRFTSECFEIWIIVNTFLFLQKIKQPGENCQRKLTHLTI